MSQFRVLYRQFLFRIVDLELLSAQGDASKLLGQFAALLLFFSAALGLNAMLFNDKWMGPQARLIALWSMEHFLIATTMAVVGLFAVLSWDSTFLDRRDVLVRARTLFLAKVAALATALSFTVLVLNVFSGITWPLRFVPENSSDGSALRSVAAYWITVLSAGGFIFCSVLCVQGLAAQLLPRRRFLRLSAFLQLAAFCLFLSVYFLQPALAAPKTIASAEMAWLPSYWFFGLLQILNGATHPAFGPLAQRALIGLALAGFGAGAAFLLSYFRTLRKIMEENGYRVI